MYVLIQTVDRKIFEERVFPYAYDVLIYTDRNNYYAKDEKGSIICTNSNTACIQEAINKVAYAGGGTVYIKPGIYKINQSINIGNNVALIGSGGYGWHKVKGSTIIETQINDYALYIRGQGITVSNITIDGKNMGSGIYIGDAYGVYIDRINIIDAVEGIGSYPDYYNSFITIIHPTMWNVRRGIVLDVNRSSSKMYRSEMFTIIGGAIYGSSTSYGEVGIRTGLIDFVTIIGTLVAYMNQSYHIGWQATGNEWITMFAPKADTVTNGLLIEDGYVDIYGLDFVDVSGDPVVVYYNAKNKVNIRSKSAIRVKLAKDTNNTSFDTLIYKEIIQNPIVIRNINNISTIQAGPIDTFDLYIGTRVGVTGERLHLQTYAPDGIMYDRVTISNYENPARVKIKNAVLNIATDTIHKTPTTGDILIDTENNKLCVYINNAWKCTLLT